ncbi:hypothetical protein BMS3Abin04_01547 [bacterium BMS3Abin04]|nr:hypothetical protein BMS3Abin04_01547 [bacterium BMS3Abin04]
MGSYFSKPGGNLSFGISSKAMFPLPEIVSLREMASLAFTFCLSIVASILNFPTDPLKDSGFPSVGSGATFIVTLLDLAK